MKSVLDIGQCDYDHASIRRMLELHKVRVLRAKTAHEAYAMLERETIHLALVNRVLDHDSSEGMVVVEELLTRGLCKAVMLVSNYPEAQSQAVAKGALPGFGKNALQSKETQALIEQVLQQS